MVELVLDELEPLLALLLELLIHMVCNVSFDISYGEDDEAVELMCCNFSGLLDPEDELQRDRSFILARRVDLMTQKILLTITKTKMAPIREPNRVCLNSIELRMETDSSLIGTGSWAAWIVVAVLFFGKRMF